MLIDPNLRATGESWETLTSNSMDFNRYRNSSIASFAVRLKNLIDPRKNLSLKRGT